MSPPELLCPAGTLKNLRYALAYGADVVYAGAPRYSLRERENEFDAESVASGIAAAHAAGRRFYLVANVLPHGAKLRTFLADLAPLVALAPDALIMADPGLIALVRERWPATPIHRRPDARRGSPRREGAGAGVGLARSVLPEVARRGSGGPRGCPTAACHGTWAG